MGSVHERVWQHGIRQLWVHERARGVGLQALLLLALLLAAGYLASNALVNLQQAGLAMGYGFLWDAASFDINQKLIPYDGTSTYARAFVVGGLNTLLVAALGILAATLIGFAVGILQLSDNFLLRRMAATYVEITRNVPLLLQIIFWWTVMLGLPRVRDSIALGEFAYLSNRGLRLPSLAFEDGAGWVGIALALACFSVLLAVRASRCRQRRTGHALPMGWIAPALLVGMPAAVYYAAGQPLALELPTAGQFNLRGGTSITPELMALWLALSTYTGAFIAEIVRGGILSVGSGQTDAAAALGLPPKLAVRKIVLPQALRAIVPPLTSQYLDLTKNSSLAVAIGYQDIVSVGDTILNQSGQALEVISIYLAFYLALSLLTSALMNWYNAKVALRGGRA